MMAPPGEYYESVFIPDIFLGASPKKLAIRLPNGYVKLCALNLFFGGAMNYKYVTETFF